MFTFDTLFKLPEMSDLTLPNTPLNKEEQAEEAPSTKYFDLNFYRKTSTAPQKINIKGSALQRGVYVAKLLMKAGFSKEQAAAQVGVFMDENNCDPSSYMKAEALNKGSNYTKNGGYGAGIGSWTGLARKLLLLKGVGLSPTTKIENLDLNTQIKMLVNDSTTYSKKYYDALKRCTNLEDAAATAYIITAGVGYSKNWNTHPTVAEAKLRSTSLGAKNDARFGKNSHHSGTFERRYNYAKQILKLL